MDMKVVHGPHYVSGFITKHAGFWSFVCNIGTLYREIGKLSLCLSSTYIVLRFRHWENTPHTLLDHGHHSPGNILLNNEDDLPLRAEQWYTSPKLKEQRTC